MVITIIKSVIFITIKFVASILFYYLDYLTALVQSGSNQKMKSYCDRYGLIMLCMCKY